MYNTIPFPNVSSLRPESIRSHLLLTRRGSYLCAIMQSVLGGTMQKAEEAVSSATSTNKKIAEMMSDIHEPASSDRMTSDFGVEIGNTDF